MNNWIQQFFFCKHDWTNHGFSYIKCRICEQVKEDREMNMRLLNETINLMVKKGLWKQEDVRKQAIGR